MNAPCRSNLQRVALFDDDQRQHEARRVCHTCPLELECRTTTLRTEAAGNPVYGVAGGLLPGERPHAMRMENRPGRVPAVIAERRSVIVRPACGTTTGARRHERAGETLCPPCLDARRKRLREAARARKTRLSA